MERVRSWLSVEHVQKTVTHNVTDLSMEDAMQERHSLHPLTFLVLTRTRLESNLSMVIPFSEWKPCHQAL